MTAVLPDPVAEATATVMAALDAEIPSGVRDRLESVARFATERDR